MDRVRSFSRVPTFPLHPSHTPPLCCSAGRNATSSPPARLAPSPDGTETRLETTARRANIALRLRDKRTLPRPNKSKKRERMSNANLRFCLHFSLVTGQNGRNNGSLAQPAVRRKTTFHSLNEQNV